MTSQQAQDDFDELLNATLPLAKQHIKKYGEFHPFGAVVSRDGKIGLIAVGAADGDRMDTFGVLELLYTGARNEADQNRAAVFLTDVRIPAGDAVRFEVEHLEGRALDIVIPYRRSRLSKSVRFGDMSVSRGEPRIW